MKTSDKHLIGVAIWGMILIAIGLSLPRMEDFTLTIPNGVRLVALCWAAYRVSDHWDKV